MTNVQPTSVQAPTVAHARDLQARLYREIGISAVAAALHSIKQPEPGHQAKVKHEHPPILRADDLAA